MSNLIFFRLEKLCPPDGSKVKFAKIKKLMQQYNLFVLQKLLTFDAQKAEAAKIEAPWCALLEKIQVRLKLTDFVASFHLNSSLVPGSHFTCHVELILDSSKFGQHGR